MILCIKRPSTSTDRTARGREEGRGEEGREDVQHVVDINTQWRSNSHEDVGMWGCEGDDTREG